MSLRVKDGILRIMGDYCSRVMTFLSSIEVVLDNIIYLVFLVAMEISFIEEFCDDFLLL